MKAFITGDRGFLGRHFTTELKARGWTVDGCDTRRRPGWTVPEDDARWHFAHNDSHYNLVVHCAAVQPHRSAIDGQPMHLADNLTLDAAMFGWAVRTGQRRVLYLSSSAAYPVSLQCQCEPLMRLAEDHIDIDAVQQPDANYGWCKLTGERMAAAARLAGVPVTVVRPFSGYGEDQGESWPFGAFTSRARRREDPFTIWGDGTQVRDWIHVTDLIDGALAVADSGTTEPVNLCTGAGTSMAELAALICRQAGYGPEFQTLPDKPAGVPYRVGDPTRMLRHYTPKVSVEEGVERACRPPS